MTWRNIKIYSSKNTSKIAHYLKKNPDVFRVMGRRLLCMGSFEGIEYGVKFNLHIEWDDQTLQSEENFWAELGIPVWL